MIIRTVNYVVSITFKNVDNKIQTTAIARQTSGNYTLDESKVSTGSYGCKSGNKLYMFNKENICPDGNINGSESNLIKRFKSAPGCRCFLKNIRKSLNLMEQNRLIKDTEIRMLEGEEI